MKDPVYAPVVVNFAIFFLNELYGFVSWKNGNGSKPRDRAALRVCGGRSAFSRNGPEWPRSLLYIPARMR